MWILPKQLHTLDFVPDTEALNLDSSESSMLCAQWLYVRSKASQSRTWSLKWKRDSWTRHLFGRILKRSHGQTFVERWTSSLADTHASHSAPQESDLANMTQGTSGRLLQTEFVFYNQGSSILRMLMGTSASDLEKSLKSWESLVTKRRGEYLARAKSGLHTKGNESLCWPTVTTAEGGKIGCQANFGQVCLSNHPAIVGLPTRLPGIKSGRPCPAKPSTHGNPPESWATPTARDHKSGRGQEERDYKELTPMVERTQSGKLNPRWVETLMGLPVGWTMPSCAYPVTIEPTNSDCSVTESSHPQQKELF